VKEFKAVFKDEEADRLLNYFISYKAIVSKDDNHQNIHVDDDLKIADLSKPETLLPK
jgi:hypothetical protein